MNTTFGFYARPQQLLVERPSFAFVANVEYEQLLLFCFLGKMIGHRRHSKVIGLINVGPLSEV